jgi:uncharacterized protein YcbX
VSAGAAATVAEIWRYPVKSMRGERLAAAEVEADGLVGDRILAVYDDADASFASAKGVRHFGALLRYTARHLADGAVEIEFPDGARVRSDAADVDARLAAALGRTHALTPRGVERVRWYSFDTPRRRAADPGRPTSGRFVDSSHVHLLTRATLASLGDGLAEAPARFRPNLVLDTDLGGYPEDAWVGRTLRVGSARLEVVERCARCVMPTLPQPDLEHDPGVRRRLIGRHDDTAGVLAAVLEPGWIAEGDAVVLEPAG